MNFVAKAGERFSMAYFINLLWKTDRMSNYFFENSLLVVVTLGGGGGRHLQDLCQWAVIGQ